MTDSIARGEPQWEQIITRTHDKLDGVRRLAVPGGWLYEVRSQTSGTGNLAFVPAADATHNYDGSMDQGRGPGPDLVPCVCHHLRLEHINGRSCTHLTDQPDGTAKVCACTAFHAEVG